MRAFRRAGYALAGALFAGALLWLLFRDANWPRLAAELQDAQPTWLALALVFALIANILRGLRWWPALNLRAKVPARAALAATMIAQFANMALPLRGGPIFRGLALSRLSTLSLPHAIGASFADRSVEAVVLALGLLVLAAGIEFDAWLPASVAADAAAAAMAGLGSFILFVSAALAGAASGHRHRWLEARLTRRLPRGAAAWGAFSAGVRDIMLSRRTFVVLIGAVGAWTFMTLGHACALTALGIPVPVILPMLTCALSTATVVLPGTPGLMGPYHAAVVAAIGLAQPGTTAETALAAALVIHAIHAGTLAVLGTMALLTEHQSLWQLDAAEDALEAEKEPDS